MMATPPPPVLHYKPNLGQHIKRQEHSSDINTTHHQHQHQHCPLFHHPSCNFMNRNILQGLQGPRESILFPLKETNHRIHFVWRGYTFTSFLYTIIVGKTDVGLFLESQAQLKQSIVLETSRNFPLWQFQPHKVVISCHHLTRNPFWRKVDLLTIRACEYQATLKTV